MSLIIGYLNQLPLAGLMLVAALGFTLGRVRIRDFALGPSPATLLIALLLGAFGLAAPPSQAGSVSLGGLGFALFIYSVGFEAGPQFGTVLRERRGLWFVLVALVVNLIAVATVCVCALIWDIDAFSAAGILAGALTSPPTFAAAAEIAANPAGLAVIFALTYPLGLVGIVLLIQIIPRVFRDELSSDAASDEEMDRSTRYAPSAGLAPEVTRAFVVEVEDAIDRPLSELDLTHGTGCVISRIHRLEDDSIEVPFGESRLQRGDRVVATGRFDELHRFEERIGPESYDQELHDPRFPTRRVLLAREAGNTLAQMNIARRFHCVVTRVRRGRTLLEPEPDLVLQRGDIMDVVGERWRVRHLAQALGRFEPASAETDIALYTGGIVLGVFLGSLKLSVGGLNLGLGTAAGLLLVGVVLGSRPRWGRLRTHVPREARQLVRDLGILLFVGETGLIAGRHLERGLDALSWPVFVTGALVNLIVVLGTLSIARLLFKLRPVDAWGSLTGGLTSSAALSALRQVADSNEATISYAAAYAFASVLATLAGPLVVWILI